MKIMVFPRRISSLDEIKGIFYIAAITIIILFNILINPCGGGVEYLHRETASRKRRRNGTKKGRAIA
jgi:hypothetical protein